MKLTEAEIISLLDLHSTSLVDLACDVVHGDHATVDDMTVVLERMRELIALLAPAEKNEEVRIQ